MKILVVCDQGNNRSVTIAHQLKYWGHDVLTAGMATNHVDTLAMLFDWADRIILTEKGQIMADGEVSGDRTFERFIADNPKFQLWDISPDIYPRPFNKDLLKKVRQLMKEHEGEYDNTKTVSD